MFTREDQHDKIYDQLVYELFCDPLPKLKMKRANKSKPMLSTRARFLKRMKEQAIKDPGEI
jgi:hypothetical protein